METTIPAHIDVSRPVGRRLVHELERKKYVEIDYPLPSQVSDSKTYTLNEVYDMCCERLSNYYGVDVKQFSTFK